MARKGRVFMPLDIQVKLGSGWTSIASDLTKVKFTEKDEAVTTTYVDGSKEKDKSGEMREVRIEFTNADKATIESVRALSGKSYSLFMKLGLVNGNNQDWYAPEVTFMQDTENEAPGNTSLPRAIIGSLRKQSSAVSVTPSTGLPASAYSHSTGTAQTSDNNYDLLIETAAS